jgi:transposase
MPRRILRVRALSSRESLELRRLIGSSLDARVVRRAQVVHLSADGMAPHRIAQLLARSWSGVRKTVNRFNREGFASFNDKLRNGRPRKTTLRHVSLLKEAVNKSPRQMGYVFGCWTLERLREHLHRRTRVMLSSARLSRLMNENQIVYRRPKHGMSHLRDPKEYDEKKAFLAFVKKGRNRLAPALTYSTSMSVRCISTRP